MNLREFMQALLDGKTLTSTFYETHEIYMKDNTLVYKHIDGLYGDYYRRYCPDYVFSRTQYYKIKDETQEI